MRTEYGKRMLAKARSKYGKPNYLGRIYSTRNNQYEAEYLKNLFNETHQNLGSDVNSISNIMKMEDAHISDLNMEEIWGSIKKIIKDEISPVSYITWIEPCELISVADDEIVLLVENLLCKEMLEIRYLTFLQNITRQVLQKDSIKIEFVVEH